MDFDLEYKNNRLSGQDCQDGNCLPLLEHTGGVEKGLFLSLELGPYSRNVLLLIYAVILSVIGGLICRNRRMRYHYIWGDIFKFVGFVYFMLCIAYLTLILDMH